MEDLDSNFRVLWQDVAEVMWPKRGNITEMRSPGTERTENLYDVTAVFASQDMAAGLASHLVPVGQDFFALSASRAEIDELEIVKVWFDIATTELHEWFAKSNFRTELNETLRSIVTFGTGDLFVKKGTATPLSFRDYPIGSYLIARDDDGLVDIVYRKFSLTAAQAMEKVEEEGWQVSEEIQKAAGDEKEMEKEFWFIHAIEPRHDYNKFLLTNLNMPYSSTYVDVKAKTVTSEGGFNRMRHNVAVFARASDEVWGRGPGTFILPVVRQVNVIEKDLTEATNKHVNPPLEVVNFDGTVKVSPGAINHVQQKDSVNRMDIAGNFPIGQEVLDAKKDVIHKAFFRDLFSLLIEERTQTKTAFETNELIQEKLQRLGPAVGRLQQQLFNPVIITSLNILLEDERIPRPPEELQGQGFDIEYLGPLALAQRNQQTVGFIRWLDVVAGAREIDPGVADNVDMDEGIRNAGRAFGVKHTTIRSTEDRDEVREQRQQAEQAAFDAEMAVKMAQATQAVPNLSQAPQEGSPAEKVMAGA
jgi:hypothetical protein